MLDIIEKIDEFIYEDLKDENVIIKITATPAMVFNAGTKLLPGNGRSILGEVIFTALYIPVILSTTGTDK